MLTWLSEGLVPFQGGVSSATVMRESSMRKMVKVRQLWRGPEVLKQHSEDSRLPSFHSLPPYHFFPSVNSGNLAQLAEWLTCTHKVPSSSPGLHKLGYDGAHP